MITSRGASAVPANRGSALFTIASTLIARIASRTRMLRSAPAGACVAPITGTRESADDRAIGQADERRTPTLSPRWRSLDGLGSKLGEEHKGAANGAVRIAQRSDGDADRHALRRVPSHERSLACGDVLAQKRASQGPVVRRDRVAEHVAY